MQPILLIDFAGTLIKPEVIEEANKFRSEILNKALPTKEEHANSAILYKANREAVGELTGITKEMELRYRENDLETINVSGEQVQNQIATNLFQISMYMAAKKYGRDMFPAGFIDELQLAKEKGYKLAIVSGVRTDIITGMLAIAKISLFDYIYGQPPVLGVSNEENTKKVQEHGKIHFVIGDKMSDIEPASSVGAKSIFVTWGHPTGGEKDVADIVISKADELRSLL